MRQPAVIEDLATPTALGLLVVGPQRGDAAFYANWLLAALKAEVLWKEALNGPGFARQVDALTTVIVPDFGMAAAEFLMRLGDNQISFVIEFDEGYSVEEFVVMAKMGFFEYRGTRYHFAIPEDLHSSTIKAAALRFAQTEDEGPTFEPRLAQVCGPRS